MGLIGDSRELTLVDLVQLKAQGQGTCRVQVQGPQGPGLLFLSGATVVHAEYAGAVGFEAASALLAEERVEYWATSDVAIPPATMEVAARTLVFEAAVRLDERRREGGSRPLPIPPRAPEPSARRRTGLVRGIAGAGALAIAVTVLALARIQVGPTEAIAVPPAPAPVAPVAPQPRDPVEAIALTGPRDELPVLVAGDPPRTPDPALPLRPTVVIRVLVDEGGTVARAEVYEPRPGLDAFEEAALAAARKFRFHPARRAGAPVPAWINWPVDFI